MKEVKFKIGDKVIVKAGKLLLIDAEITNINPVFDGALIDYELKINDIIFGTRNACFEQQFLFTREEALEKLQDWISADWEEKEKQERREYARRQNQKWKHEFCENLAKSHGICLPTYDWLDSDFNTQYDLVRDCHVVTYKGKKFDIFDYSDKATFESLKNFFEDTAENESAKDFIKTT